MGIKLKVLDPTPACPASVVAEQTEGSFRDPEAVKAFAQGCDVLTVEIEHIDADAMQAGLRGAWGLRHVSSQLSAVVLLACHVPGAALRHMPTTARHGGLPSTAAEPAGRTFVSMGPASPVHS